MGAMMVQSFESPVSFETWGHDFGNSRFSISPMVMDISYGVWHHPCKATISSLKLGCVKDLEI